MLFSRVKISWHHEDITWYFIGVYMIKKDIALGPENNILMIRKGVARARLSIVFTGFVRVLEILESPGILLSHFPGLESPGKILLVLESPGNLLN